MVVVVGPRLTTGTSVVYGGDSRPSRPSAPGASGRQCPTRWPVGPGLGQGTVADRSLTRVLHPAPELLCRYCPCSIESPLEPSDWPWFEHRPAVSHAVGKVTVPAVWVIVDGVRPSRCLSKTSATPRVFAVSATSRVPAFEQIVRSVVTSMIVLVVFTLRLIEVLAAIIVLTTRILAGQGHFQRVFRGVDQWGVGRPWSRWTISVGVGDDRPAGPSR